MSPRVWILGPLPRAAGLADALRSDGVQVVSATEEGLAGIASAAYDGQGVLIADLSSPRAREALETSPAVRCVTVLAVADENEPVPDGALPLPADEPASALSHHIREVLAEASNLRRHPRVPVDLDARVGGRPTRLRDASLYGAWIQPIEGVHAGQDVVVEVRLEDGGGVALTGRVVAVRGDGAAVSCRPRGEGDLLGWVHLLLGELEKSPLHPEPDPFGPLFAGPPPDRRRRTRD